MVKKQKFQCVFLIFVLLAFFATAQPPSGYKLVYENNFSTTESNVGNTNFDYYVKDGSRSWARPENVNISDGTLNITCKQEATTNSQGVYRNYTGGEYGLPYPFLYGYFEASVRVPYESGLWGAFWLYGCPQNKYGEIDILEFYSDKFKIKCPIFGRCRDVSSYNASLHFQDESKSYCQTQGTENVDVGNFDLDVHCNSFHKYACLWTPNEVKFFLDDVYVGSLPPGNRLRGALSITFDMLVNESTFSNIPTDMKVDYVKVWQKENESIFTRGDQLNLCVNDWRANDRIGITLYQQATYEWTTSSPNLVLSGDFWCDNSNTKCEWWDATERPGPMCYKYVKALASGTYQATCKIRFPWSTEVFAERTFTFFADTNVPSNVSIIANPMPQQCETVVTAFADPQNCTFNWTINNSWTSDGNSITLPLGNYHLEVNASNACGSTSANSNTYADPNMCPMFNTNLVSKKNTSKKEYVIYPNPIDKELSVRGHSKNNPPTFVA